MIQQKVSRIDACNKSQAIYDLLVLAETPEGFIRLVPKILETIGDDPKYKAGYRLLLDEIAKEDEELIQYNAVLIDWMIKKLRFLRRTPYYERAYAKIAIDRAERFLQGKESQIQSNYIEGLKGYFEDACQAVALFGGRKGFGKWAKTRKMSSVVSFHDNNIPVFAGNITPFCKEGEVLERVLGGGFHKASIEKSVFGSIPRFAIVRGRIVQIHYPEPGEVWKKMQNLLQWKAAVDSMPSYNLKHLLLLCKHSEPRQSTPESRQFTSSLQALEISNQQVLQYYLSGFLTDTWENAPTSKNKIMAMIDRLLAFLNTQSVDKITIKAIPRSSKRQLREFIQKVLKDELLDLSLEIRNRKQYADLIPVVMRRATKELATSTVGITDHLIQTECRKFAKQHGWLPNRGPDKSTRKEPS